MFRVHQPSRPDGSHRGGRSVICCATHLLIEGIFLFPGDKSFIAVSCWLSFVLRRALESHGWPWCQEAVVHISNHWQYAAWPRVDFKPLPLSSSGSLVCWGLEKGEYDIEKTYPYQYESIIWEEHEKNIQYVWLALGTKSTLWQHEQMWPS